MSELTITVKPGVAIVYEPATGRFAIDRPGTCLADVAAYLRVILHRVELLQYADSVTAATDTEQQFSDEVKRLQQLREWSDD